MDEKRPILRKPRIKRKSKILPERGKKKQDYLRKNERLTQDFNKSTIPDAREKIKQ